MRCSLILSISPWLFYIFRRACYPIVRFVRGFWDFGYGFWGHFQWSWLPCLGLFILASSPRKFTKLVIPFSRPGTAKFLDTCPFYSKTTLWHGGQFFSLSSGWAPLLVPSILLPKTVCQAKNGNSKKHKSLKLYFISLPSRHFKLHSDSPLHSANG